MSHHNEYKDQLVDFIVNDGMPKDAIPLLYVEVGPRTSGVFDPSAPYEFMGVHLMGTREVFQYPGLRQGRSFLQDYTAEYKKTQDPEKTRFSIYSLEWWDFLERLCYDWQSSGFMAPIYDLLFMPQQYEEKVMSLVYPGLLAGVSAFGARTLFHNAYTYSDDQIKYRQLQALYLWETDNWEWDYSRLLAYYPILTVLSQEECSEEVRNRITAYATRLRAFPDAHAVRATDIVMQNYRMSLL
jgi:hypothetical protein